MKDLNKLKWLAGALSLAVAGVWLTGCGDDNVRGGAASGTNAPASIAAKSITHTITSGAAPLPGAGSFVLQTDGSPGDVTGTYTITGSGGVSNSMGSYTYTMTDANAALLVLQDSVLGEVDESMTFRTPNSGTFSSSTPSGGTQAGSFTTN